VPVEPVERLRRDDGGAPTIEGVVLGRDGKPDDVRRRALRAAPAALEHRARRLDRDETVHAGREAEREVAGAGAELDHVARAPAQERLHEGERLPGIGRAVLIRRRDFLVGELGRVVGREVPRPGSLGGRA
jgi:hypothetical protein